MLPRSSQVFSALQAIRQLRSLQVWLFDITLFLHDTTQNHNATVRSPSVNAVGMLLYFLFLFQKFCP